MLTIKNSWKPFLEDECNQAYFKTLQQKISQEIKNGNTVFPLPKDIFNAFEYSELKETKVVILGQDPYHSLSLVHQLPSPSGRRTEDEGLKDPPHPNPLPKGEGTKLIPTAHGLSFSVQKGVTKLPPSLKNIYKELETDLGISKNHSGNLEPWARQGVLLLNAALTVRAHEANSHANWGWHKFTDKVIQHVSTTQPHVVFILWGGFARKKKPLINTKKHFVIESAHPSPLSAYNGFFGSKPFSKTNEWLSSKNTQPINWQI